MYGGLSLQMPEVNSCCFPLVGVAVLDGSSLLSVALGGSSLHRWVSPFWWSFSIEMCRHARCRSCGDDRTPCSVGYPCCLLFSMDYPCRSQQLLFSIDGCRHARCRSCGDDRSQQRLSVMLYGSSLHWWVSPFLFGHPCRCQKSTATVLHWWVSPFSMDHPCCLLCSMGHPCIGRCRHVWWVIPAEVNSCCPCIDGCRHALWVFPAEVNSDCPPSVLRR